MQIDHIGYLVRDMEKSIRAFEAIGYTTVTEIIDDDKDCNGKKPRNVRLCFLQNGNYRIELVSPIGDDSIVSKIAYKYGETPYHICYRVDCLNDAIARLKKEEWIVIEPEAPAIAFNNTPVAFLFRNGIGLIELVEYK